MKKEIEANRRLWNDLTTVHLKGSEVYPVEEFKKGKNVLKDVELKEVGDVKGKEMLHLQCHFGMDTLSWARLGAKVTGVDISDEAISTARSLAIETGVNAEFLRSDILALEGKLTKKFDIVFASYGALYWIPDIRKWCQVASGYLKTNGFLYIVDGHPVNQWLSRNETETEISKFRISYFDRCVQRYEACPDYADQTYQPEFPEYGWHYTLSDLINAVIEAGLRVDHFNEFSSFEIANDNDKWKPIRNAKKSPVMFSVKATKD